MADYTHFEKSAPVLTNGACVGAYGSETEVVSSSGELKNQVAKTDNFVVLGINDVVTSGGTWTQTRIAAGNYSLDKTAGADTSYIIADITEILRSTASRGLKLTSFSVVDSIATDVLTTHGRTVNSVTYANNAAVSVATTFGGTLTGALPTATQANPYLTNVTLGTPVWMNTANTKVNIELTQVATATCVYKFYGIILYFDSNPL